MRIVIASHHYPPTFVAGVELLTQRLATWMARRGHTVDVVCIDDIDGPEPFGVRTEEQDGVSVHRLSLQLTGNVDPLGMRHADPVLGAWFAQFLRGVRPDVFHSQSSYLLSASLIEAAKAEGVPVVASLHDYWYLCPRITLLRSDGTRCTSDVTAQDCAQCLAGERRRGRLLHSLGGSASLALFNPGLVDRVADRQHHLDEVLRSVDQVVTPALFTRELLLARGYQEEHVRLVRQGLQKAPPTERTSADTNRLRIGYMGQLAPHKGVHVLIEALGKLHPSARTPELVIYGDSSRFPDYSASLRQLAAKLPNVSFAGTYTNDSVWKVLNEIDVLVVPSLWYEISPLVILESLSAGVPVIASDLRNMNYQIHAERDGLLFNVGDSAHLSAQLQRLLDDSELLDRLRRGIQPPYPVEKEMLEIEGIYARVISRTGLTDSSSAPPDNLRNLISTTP